VTAVAAIRHRLDREAQARLVHDTGRNALAGAVAGAALALSCRRAGLPEWLCLTAAILPPAAAALRGWSGARRRWTPAAVADRIEREHPVDNLLVTAEALGRDGHHPFLAPVAAAAWARLETIPAATHDVAGRGLLAAAIVLAGTLGVIAIDGPASAPAERAALAPADGGPLMEPSISSVAIDVRAPAYLGGTRRVARDASRVEVPAGAVVSFVVATDAQTITVARDGAAAVEHPATGGAARITVDEPLDGIWTLAPRTRGQQGRARLVVVQVVPDAAPEIRVTEPARDRRLAKPAADLAVRLEVTDDHALTGLLLRYTRVSGGGESFTFADHDLPVVATRRTAADWTAEVTLPLASMDLEDGDLVVYRGVATDGRPGAAPVESEAFVVEIGALREASSAAGGGEDVDPDQRQAISQQMVIVKTERLHARSARLDDATRLGEAQGLAIEQRMVRAEFVFLMGGEVQDEVEEAAQAPDLAEGRQENQGQSALLNATRAMSRAEARLTAGDTAAALVAEREALRFLQQAFDRRRFLLRPIAERARIDPARRLQGTPPRTAGPRLAVAEPHAPEGWRAVERAAVAVARARADTSADLVPVAAALTALDRTDAEIARVAAALVAAADPGAKQAALADAQRLVHASAARSLVRAPAAIPAPSVSGAVADALRRGGPR
jgi:hypothetical protein